MYRRYQSLLTAKSSKQNLMNEVDEYFTPSDNLITGRAKLTSSAYSGALHGELLDTTGSDLIEEYVAFVLGLQYTSDVRWFNLKAKGVEATADINKKLTNRADRLLELLDNSSYYSVMSSLERDVVLHGHGLIQFKGDERDFVKCSSPEPYGLVISQDSFNKMSGAAWIEQMPSFELLERFPSLIADRRSKNQLEVDFDKMYNLLVSYMSTDLHYFENRPEEHKNAKFVKVYTAYPAGMQASKIVDNSSSLMNIDEKDWEVEQTVFPARGAYAKNRAYSEGMGRRALPKSRITNKLMYMLLKLGGQQANPARIQHPAITAEAGNRGELQEGQVFTLSEELVEGAKMSDLVTLLQTTGQLEPLMNIYQMVNHQLLNLLPTASSIYKVARQSISEIQQRLSEQNKRLKPLRQTFLNEGPKMHLKYLYNLADKQARFNSEEFKLPENLEVEFKIDISMLQSFRQDKGLRIAQALGVASNFISLQPSAADLINADKAVEVCFDGYQVADVLETRADVSQKRKAQMQKMEEQRAMQQQQAFASADNANASLINTLVKGQAGG